MAEVVPRALPAPRDTTSTGARIDSAIDSRYTLPPVRITILGSGSKGNATLFDAGATRVLVDAGLRARELRTRSARALGAPLDRLDGIVITHSHCDHVSHVRAVARAFGAPVFLTSGTRAAVFPDLAPPADLELREYSAESSFRVGGIAIQAIDVPHDVPQVALVLRHGHACTGLVTDLGHVPARLPALLGECSTLLVEANHCPDLLANGPYPRSVRARIAGRRGHLANEQTAELLAALPRNVLQRVVLMHLSAENNDAARARAAAEAALGARRLASGRVRLMVASQHEPLVLESRHGTQLSLF